MAESDKTQTLEMRISILRDKLAEQATTYDKMQNKMFALVGLLLTSAGLLSSEVFKISAPDTVLEYIIFVSALILLGVSALLVCYNYRSKKDWSVPVGPVEETKLDNAASYEDALLIAHQDYKDAYHERMKTLDRKAMYLNSSLYLFVISVILLIVLKIGG